MTEAFVSEALHPQGMSQPVRRPPAVPPAAFGALGLRENHSYPNPMMPHLLNNPIDNVRMA
eukprot:2240001-Heterocapsa_arctica.AAC.1